MIPNTYNREMVFQVIRGEREAKFLPDWLISNGFKYMGSAWGNRGQDYYQIDTEIGGICVVDFKEVWLEKGREEVRLERIKTPNQLETFLSLLS
ncbi:hypothetical protein [Sphingobacterium sp. 1.A.4]|uniref:hypothetical protein n=1 Tax=Sphingobacterium sp. 1.A.4 TaxID=2044603 RepID=UPI0015D51181|nr:hypothetical protein [Sphingobacterium sp. 1.A.4]